MALCYHNGLPGDHELMRLAAQEVIRANASRVSSDVKLPDHAREYKLLKLILEISTLPASLLKELAQQIMHVADGTIRDELATHPNAGLDVWRAIASCPDPTNVSAEILAQIPDARRDSSIRPYLLACAETNDFVIGGLCRDLSPDTPTLFRKLLDRNPQGAADLIIDPNFKGLHLLSRTDLVPLLRSPNNDCRLAAILALSKIDQPSSLDQEEDIVDPEGWRRTYIKCTLPF